LLGAGCLDHRLDVLERQIEPLLADPGAVAKLQPEETDELRSLAPQLREACRRLAEAGLPPTLVHGDLHVGNVARHRGELQYFDWTDACVAHPFFDLHSLQWEQSEANRDALLQAYLAVWEGVVAPERLRDAAELARIVIPLHHAVSYRTIVRGLEPVAQSEMDATHGFLREALVRARDWSDG
jgi:aminoglycoside phosphotransferase (APT) family kinase protein